MGQRRKLLKHISFFNSRNPTRDFRDKLINALIMAGLGFCKTLVGLGTAGMLLGRVLLADPASYLLTAAVFAGLEFFSYLAIARGITLTEG